MSSGDTARVPGHWRGGGVSGRLGFVVECAPDVRDLTRQTEAFGDGAKRMKYVLLRNKGKPDSVFPCHVGWMKKSQA